MPLQLVPSIMSSIPSHDFVTNLCFSLVITEILLKVALNTNELPRIPHIKYPLHKHFKRIPYFSKHKKAFFYRKMADQCALIVNLC